MNIIVINNVVEIEETKKENLYIKECLKEYNLEAFVIKEIETVE